MSEPGDRPTAAAGGAKPYPGAPAPLAPEAPPPAADGAAYRPLSVPAVVGCALAALYAVFLTVCWGASFLTGMPLILSSYTLLLPLAAVLLAALGWVQVQRSEGTQAGGTLAVWGMALGALFGLSYGAYLAATRAALCNQAEGFARQWIDLVQQGQFDEAFRLTIPPERRPAEGPELRRNLELRFNTIEDIGRAGPLTSFRENDVVLLLNHARTPEGAADTEVRSLGVGSWDYRGGSYYVQLEYQLRGPGQAVRLQISLQGTETHQEGRQWAVILKETDPRPPFQPTPLGERLAGLNASSSAFVKAWVAKVGEGKRLEAYLDTLEPARRRELQAEEAARLVASASAPGVGAAADLEGRVQDLLPGYRPFVQGDLLRAGEKTFWAEGRQRTAIPAEVRQLFSQAPAQFAAAVETSRVNAPIWEKDGDKLRLFQDFQLVAPPAYRVEGSFVTETDAAAVDRPGAPVWRLAAINLTSGRSLATPAGPPRRP